MFIRFHSFVLGLLTLVVIGCANVSIPPEQSALPAAPTYEPTEIATAAPLAPKVSPTLARPTPAAQVNGFPAALPTERPRPAARAPIVQKVPVRDLAALNEYQRGIAYTAVKRDEYQSESSLRALDELFATGANYISLLVTWYQTDVTSREIFRAENTPSDEELAHVIAYAHAHNIKVLLKPQVDLAADPAHWRGQIEFENEADWQTWFASYREFILHYAKFAQENGVEEFSVGTELVGTTTRTADWRALIGAVRNDYTGLLTYSANHSGEDVQVQFWDDLDFIGINAFYHLTTYRTPTMQDILEGWRQPAQRLTMVHEKFPNQPIIFTEVGYPSMDLASVWPWNWQRSGTIDLEEQAMLYEGLFQTWWFQPGREWFRGLFIWNWIPDPNQGGAMDANYTPHGKPAEEILKYYFQIKSPNRPNAAP